MRGIAFISAVTLYSELGDLKGSARRFANLAVLQSVFTAWSTTANAALKGN